MGTGATLMSALGRLLEELRRRRVAQVALGYVALSWLTLQVGDLLYGALALPEWSLRLLLGLLAAGFPIALALSWFFDLTPAGLRRDSHDHPGSLDEQEPHVAALLVLQSLEGPQHATAARVRPLLADFHCAEHDYSGDGLAAEFRSVADALDCALRVLREHGTSLRGGLAIGELTHAGGHMAGDALADAHAAAHLAQPGGLAATAALHRAALSRVHPELAGLMRPGGDDAFVADPEAIAQARAPVRRPAAAVAPRRTISAAIAVALGLALVVGGIAWLGSDPPPRVSEASIAVLPFTTLSSNKQDRYFAEGLADELQDALSGVEGLQVASRTSAYALRDKGLDVKALGAALGVANVLDATVRRSGDSVRISARLSDTRTGFTLWSRSFDQKLDDIFTVQREIASQVTRALLGVLPNEGKPLAQRLAPTQDVGAYDNYLRGRELLNRTANERTLSEAISLFGTALAADASFARAQAGICIAEIRRFEGQRDPEALGRAKAACERAVGMDPNLHEVDLALGDLHRAQDEVDLAEERYTRALADPNLRTPAYLGLARLEADKRRDDLALQYFDRARKLDPGNWRTYLTLGNFHGSRSQLPEALDAYRTAIRLAPEDATSPWNNLGVVLVQMEDYERAADALNRSVAIDPTHSALSNLGSVRFVLGDYAAAAELFDRATRLAPTDPRTWGNLADALAEDAKGAARSREAYEQAATHAVEWIAEKPADREAVAMLAWYRANLDQPQLARELAARAEEGAPEDPDVAFWNAQTYARLGDAAAAARRIEVARAGGISRRMLAALPALKGVELPAAAPGG